MNANVDLPQSVRGREFGHSTVPSLHLRIECTGCAWCVASMAGASIIVGKRQHWARDEPGPRLIAAQRFESKRERRVGGRGEAALRRAVAAASRRRSMLSQMHADGSWRDETWCPSACDSAPSNFKSEQGCGRSGDNCPVASAVGEESRAARPSSRNLNTMRSV